MRVSLNNLRRWWTRDDAVGHGEVNRGVVPEPDEGDPDRVNGHGHGHGHGHAKAGGNGRGKAEKAEKPAKSPPTPADPPWLLELDKAGVPRTLHYPTTTLGRLLDQTADRFGDADAIVYHNLRWTYRELL